MSHWNQLDAFALVAAGPGFAGLLSQIFPFVAMFLVFYLIVLRPMSNQDKDRRKRLESLKKGDQVVLGGGLIGRISNYDDPKIAVVELADRVKVRVLKKDITDTLAEALKADAGKSEKSSKAAPEKSEHVDKPKPTDDGKSPGTEASASASSPNKAASA